jgi:hypothetical protein
MILNQRNDKVFNQEQWHELKVKHLIRDDHIMYTKMAWARIVEIFKISAYSTKALLKDFHETCSTRNVLDMIEWKSHGTGNDNVCHFGCLLAWGCPWLGSLVGLLLRGSFLFLLLMWRCGMSEGFRLPSKWAYLP